MIDSTEQFRAAILSAGLAPPREILGDGKLHRFPTNGKSTDDSGWYALHLDDVPYGAFGCWRSGLNKSWCGKAVNDMTKAELESHRARVKFMQTQRLAELEERQRQASAAAALLWKAAIPAADHKYLTDKGVKPHGIKSDGHDLLVPMYDAEGKLHSLQTIAPNGSKRFQLGGRVAGCFHVIGTLGEVLVVCEGYATGASIHEATGLAVAVAFTASNLQAVASALHSKYAGLRMILAADDDWQTEGNPGVTKAIAAARAVGGVLAIPRFPAERDAKATDFNDLYLSAGVDEVKAQIEAALHGDRASLSPDWIEAESQCAVPEVVLLNGSDLVPEPVRWLWTDWLALGKLHILAGSPGQGKTTIALACAATVSVGGRWPDGSLCEPGNILVWSGEDDPADTLLPRLLAAGADRTRCYFVRGTRIGDEVQPFDPARDMGALETQARRIGGIKLLIVDPVVSAVAGDSHKNTEVRRALQPLVDLASRLDAAVLGISHFSKGGVGADPASRVVGSIAFTAVARVVLVAAKVKGDDDEQDRRILARGKSNIGPDDGGFEYRIAQAEPLPGIEASYIVWGKSVAGSARELLAEPEACADKGGESSAQAEAEEFLIQLLKAGPSPTKHVKAEADAAGIAWRTVRRASDALGIKKRKLQDAWYWEQPNLPKQLVQDVQLLNVGQVGQLDGQDDARGVQEVQSDSDESEVF